MERITSPAQRVITKCGKGDFSKGLRVVAAWTGKHITRVQRWTYPKARGGTGGLIPTQEQQVILTAALREGIALDPADFFFTGGELAPGMAVEVQPT
ncbi:MAG: hypothetical protein J0H79_14145 [Alphaproteobacteria bacterium]|nr:hypothetical protein [Alphaproteobacteria bacterium]